MLKQIWVDGRGARTGALVVLVGFVLLLATQVMRGEVNDLNCASIASSARTRECVAQNAQTLDRGRLDSIGAVALAVGTVAVGGALVLRARRRVMNLDEAAKLLEIDVPGVRSLIAEGDLMSYGTHGRTYVDAVDVEKSRRDLRAARRAALPGAL